MLYKVPKYRANDSERSVPCVSANALGKLILAACAAAFAEVRRILRKDCDAGSLHVRRSALLHSFGDPDVVSASLIAGVAGDDLSKPRLGRSDRRVLSLCHYNVAVVSFRRPKSFRRREDYSSMPHSHAAEELLEMIGSGKTNVAHAQGLAAAMVRDGIPQEAVTAFASLGSFGAHGSNAERDLHRWLRGLYGMTLEPYFIDVTLESDDGDIDEPEDNPLKGTVSTRIPVLLPHEVFSAIHSSSDYQVLSGDQIKTHVVFSKKKEHRERERERQAARVKSTLLVTCACMYVCA